MNRSLSIFQKPDAQIEDVRQELKSVDAELQQLQDSPEFIPAGATPDSLHGHAKERAILDLKIRRDVFAVGLRALEKMIKGGDAAESAAAGASLELEAIIKAKYRPALVFTKDHMLRQAEIDKLGVLDEDDSRSWSKFVAAAVQAKTAGGRTPLDISRSVARVQHASGPCIGTAWTFARDNTVRLMTNRHVVRDQGWYYQDVHGKWLPIDDKRGCLNYNAVLGGSDHGEDEFDLLAVCGEPHADAAYLAPHDAQRVPLEIVREAREITGGGDSPKEVAAALSGRMVAVIGHPMVAGSDPADEVALVFDGAPLKLKRFMPGRLNVQKPVGDDNGVPVLMHDCSTLKGASGSCIIDLGPLDVDFGKPESLPKTYGKVIGLHFGGRWSQSNYAVPTWELVKQGLLP